jgi:hypothetical protein
VHALAGHLGASWSSHDGTSQSQRIGVESLALHWWLPALVSISMSICIRDQVYEEISHPPVQAHDGRPLAF